MRTVCALVLLGACTSALADASADIAAQQSRVDALQKAIEPLVAPLETTHADVRVFASLAPIVSAVDGLNHLPPTQRTITLQSTEAKGHFYNNESWCNSFAELQGPGDLHAQGVLSRFNATLQDNGDIELSTHASTSGHLQAHVQLFGPRLYAGGIHLGGGACPYGGGIGSHVGANFNKDLDLHIRFAFTPAPDGSALAYQATLYDPQKVSVTISIGLGRLGSYGYVMAFDVPHSTYTGTLPLLIENGGKFTLPGEKKGLEYALQLKPASLSVTKAGITAEWTSAIDFKTPTVAAAH